MTEPFVRESGEGPPVVCLHANASSSSQWRALMERLAPRFRVFAPDGYGAGKSPEWPSDRVITLDDEVRLIEPLLARIGSPVCLVGHSYGGAVALVAALRHPKAVRALALYEPTLFSVLDPHAPAPNGVEGIVETVALAAAALDRGDRESAARHFIDYWMGAGTFAAMLESRRPAVIDSAVNVRRWAHALMVEKTSLAPFSRLAIPVLYLTGARSPRSARVVAERLLATLPNARHVEFGALGHMGPVTHPEVVNAEIDSFLAGAGTMGASPPTESPQ